MGEGPQPGDGPDLEGAERHRETGNMGARRGQEALGPLKESGVGEDLWGGLQRFAPYIVFQSHSKGDFCVHEDAQGHGFQHLYRYPHTHHHHHNQDTEQIH